MFGISLAALLSICGATSLRDYKDSNEDTLGGMLDEVEAMEMMLKDLLVDETKGVLNAGMDDKEDLDIFSDVGTEGNNLAAQLEHQVNDFDNKGRMRSFDLIDPVGEVDMFKTHHRSIPIPMNNTNIVFLQSMKEESFWMGRQSSSLTYVADAGEKEKDQFKWKIVTKRTPGPPNLYDLNLTPSLAGCVKYGERIFLLSTATLPYLPHILKYTGLSTPQKSYLTDDPLKDVNFDWVIRSTIGDGRIDSKDVMRDPMYNKCVTYNSVFYLQSMAEDFRFLTAGSYIGNNRAAGVYTVNPFIQGRDKNLLKWIARPGYDFNGNGKLTHATYLHSDSSPVKGEWKLYRVVGNASWSSTVTLTVSRETQELESNDITDDWRASVEASVEAGFDIPMVGSGSVSVGAGSELGLMTTMSVSSSITHIIEQSDTIKIEYAAPTGAIYKFVTSGTLINTNKDFKEESWKVDTGHYISSLNGPPCCPPGFFINEADAQSDCRIPEYNLCKEQLI